MTATNCPLKINTPNLAQMETVSIQPETKLAYQQAAALAKEQAEERFAEYMLISWYDRDRDFESPPNSTESPGDEKDGYIHYALSHGAKLKVDIEKGRFIFFFSPVEW